MPLAQLEPLKTATDWQYSVLVIDDDPDQADVLRIQLQRQGFAVVTAACGREGLAAARSQPPHLVLLDLRLPDVDGFEVCQQLADDPLTSAIPIIILSAMERPDIIRRARSAGGQYYVRKPYDPNVLQTLIQCSLRTPDEF